VYQQNDLHHVLHLGGRSSPRGYDEAQGAWGEGEAYVYAVRAGPLSAYFACPGVGVAKSIKRDGLVIFLELKSYKQWKPTNGEGTSKKLKEGVEGSFDLIKMPSR
jgi:hypothetical protein